jgi:hypothetical protein
MGIAQKLSTTTVQCTSQIHLLGVRSKIFCNVGAYFTTLKKNLSVYKILNIEGDVQMYICVFCLNFATCRKFDN